MPRAHTSAQMPLVDNGGFQVAQSGLPFCTHEVASVRICLFLSLPLRAKTGAPANAPKRLLFCLLFIEQGDKDNDQIGRYSYQ